MMETIREILKELFSLLYRLLDVYGGVVLVIALLVIMMLVIGAVLIAIVYYVVKPQSELIRSIGQPAKELPQILRQLDASQQQSQQVSERHLRILERFEQELRAHDTRQTQEHFALDKSIRDEMRTLSRREERPS